MVGATASYGPEALIVGTTVKLTRALWIIPLSFLSMFLFRKKDTTKISIPWFIFLFVLAMVASTYLPIPKTIIDTISLVSHKFLSITLFLIGCSLSIQAIKKVGIKPVLLGISLWIIISIVSLIVIM